MALRALFSTFLVTTPPRMSLPFRSTPSDTFAIKPVQCVMNKTNPKTTNIDQGAPSRRNPNYPPSFWDYSFVKSLSSDYAVLLLSRSN